MWQRFTYLALSSVWLFALFNPVLKKYDYGAGYPVVVIFTVLVAVVAFLSLERKSEKAYFEKFFIGLFLLFVTLAFLFSEMFTYGFSEYLAFSSTIILYFILAFRKIEFKEKLLKVFILGASAAIFMGFLFYLSWDEVRMMGPFFNKLTHSHSWPNAFALFLISTWPLGFLIKVRWQRNLFFSFSLAALLLTFSRGALIVLGGQIFLLFIAYIKRLKVMDILLVGLSVTMIFFGTNLLRAQFFPVLSIEDKVQFETHEGDKSKDDRVTFWLGALEIIQDYPLLGTGPFSFRWAYNEKQTDLLVSADHPHNLFLKIGSEYGLPALMSFLAIILANFFTVISRYRKVKEKDMLHILVVGVLGIFAHNLIDFNLNFLATLVLLFVFLAFIRSIVVGKERKRDSVIIFVAMILAVIAIFDAGLQVISLIDQDYAKYRIYQRGDHPGIINKIDSEAFYAQAEVECESGNFTQCLEYLEKAMELNPLNEFKYYHTYLEYFPSSRIIEKVVPMLETYFNYVKHNTNFTAYTENVEEVSEIIDLIVEYDEGYLWLLEKKKEMLADAWHARNNKSF